MSFKFAKKFRKKYVASSTLPLPTKKVLRLRIHENMQTPISAFCPPLRATQKSGLQKRAGCSFLLLAGTPFCVARWPALMWSQLAHSLKSLFSDVDLDMDFKMKCRIGFGFEKNLIRSSLVQMQDDWIQVIFKEWLDTFLLIFMQNKQYRITSENFIIFANFWKNLNLFMFKSFRSGIFESDPAVEIFLNPVLCEISDLLLLVSYFASQSKEWSLVIIFPVCCVN